MVLRSLKEMIGYKMKAKDGEFGKVSDFYFDDEYWVIRYAVDKTGYWLFGKEVLISPSSFEKPDWENRSFPVSLTKDQIRKSPTIDADKPVSKEKEIKPSEFHYWPASWTLASGAPYSQQDSFSSTHNVSAVNRRVIARDETEEEGKLRSTEEVIGYTIISDDKGIGYVEDFIVDDGTWEIRYMMLDTKKILTGKHVIIAPEWIKWIGWAERRVSVDLAREKINGCPDFDVSLPVSREYEETLYEYYNCPKYWMKDKND